MTNFIENSLDEAASVLSSFKASGDSLGRLKAATGVLGDCLQGGGAVLSCGNGGSMCDAMHFAEELTGRYRKDRKPLPARAISDPGYLSCVANDYGYDQVFSRYVEAWLKEGDCLLAISTSGRSQNIIEAVNVANAKGGSTIGLLGKGGGKLKDLVKFPIVIPSDVTDRVQEVHIKIIHILIEGIERRLFPENYR